MDKIKVVHVVPTLSPGGAERVVAHIVRGLDRRKYEPGIIVLGRHNKSELDNSIMEAGIEARYLGKLPGFDWRMCFRLQHTLRDCQPNIVHTHMQVLRYALPSILSFKNVSWVHTVHNLAEREIEWAARWIHRSAFLHGVVPVAVAEQVANSVKRLYRMRLCEVIPNGIPTNYYASPAIPRSDWRAREGFRDDDVLFVCVARFSTQKNHVLLLRAFAEGPASNSNAHLLLLGNGELQEQLEIQAASLGIHGKVHFLGTRTDIPDVLGASDIFVLSSDYEGNPLSLLEAMAAGLPIVSTAVGGVPDLFEDGMHGLIVQPGEARGLSSSMQYLLGNQESRLFWGAAAAERARDKFDVSTMVKAYEKLYEELLDIPHHRGGESAHREEALPAGYA